ncbi:hypothetical protein HPB51_008442 [Rhipicephalus microplus]|uniref:Peptidase M13 C-terminal domain-containing protein n=1 Tax=Rhipicephalus microplus TaxID=6941 RepID=A0A9J6EZZ1_RHIMP|nr:hypothetical protein HPB51_008442 [Rhipicephalus microplus]
MRGEGSSYRQERVSTAIERRRVATAACVKPTCFRRRSLKLGERPTEDASAACATCAGCCAELGLVQFPQVLGASWKRSLEWARLLERERPVELLRLFSTAGEGERSLKLSLIRQEKKLNGATDSENLCDFVGTMVAYAAYSSLPSKYKNVTLASMKTSSEQLFFMSHCLKWCDQYCSRPAPRYAAPRSRCIVPLVSMPEFSSAFKCVAGTPKNPRNKCKFW